MRGQFWWWLGWAHYLLAEFDGLAAHDDRDVVLVGDESHQRRGYHGNLERRCRRVRQVRLIRRRQDCFVALATNQGSRREVQLGLTALLCGKQQGAAKRPIAICHLPVVHEITVGRAGAKRVGGTSGYHHVLRRQILGLASD